MIASGSFRNFLGAACNIFFIVFCEHKLNAQKYNNICFHASGRKPACSKQFEPESPDCLEKVLSNRWQS